ncbi:MAG TPA: acyltransferase [bacterium]|nr:acyltransferase [bacterium]
MNKKKSFKKVPAWHGRKSAAPDPAFHHEFSQYLSESMDREALVALYGRFRADCSQFGRLMCAIVFRALADRVGTGIRIEAGVGFSHPETFDIGDGVFLGEQTFIQGRHDGRCKIGNYVWIGPQSYFDARDLIIEDYVGWGPGAKVLGSSHTGMPIEEPLIATELEIRPVRIKKAADIGVNAIILPGVVVGEGSIIGAGAVVAEDVAPYAIVAGVPARFLRWRDGYKPSR